MKVKVGTGEQSPVVALAPPQAVRKVHFRPARSPTASRGELDAKVNGESVQTPLAIR